MKLKSSWFLPLTLADPYFISFKAGLAVSLASAFSLYLADNPDLTSACFVAVVSISPTPLLGFKTYVNILLYYCYFLLFFIINIIIILYIFS